MNRILKSFDIAIFIAVGVLIALSVTFIYSSDINSDGVLVSRKYIKQIVFAAVGIIVMFMTALYDYRRTSRYCTYLFTFLVAILLLTKFAGLNINNANSWLAIGPRKNPIFTVQPSEFCKIFYIIFLAWYLERSRNKAPLLRFAVSFLIMMVPLGLILIQPDLGTASVYVPIMLVMAFMADIPAKYILTFICFGVLTVVFMVLPVWETDIVKKSIPMVHVLSNFRMRLIVILASAAIVVIGIFGTIYFQESKVFFWIAVVFGVIMTALVCSYLGQFVLKEYQISRLIIFLDPYVDPRGRGYNVIQSKLAIGSGMMTGKGFLQGSMSHLQFLPERSTDFIFSIYSEEMGFIGCMCIFLCYFVILIRNLFVIRATQNYYGMLIASGILGMMFFHFIVNVGMVMGIMPITGIPLIFMSYGGSSMWTGMICMGLLMSINNRKLDFMR